ncbi:hypothetical protein [Paenibacillus elgii]|uniref:hypothetical protein n=1 Tax=Paenibacillus elgii TaxID=189691 RepID=UPI00203AE15F|nr:hypothetical protein [Paenibacillus elgii]MCM3273074.1 hypothetical protein [Paenibacillus elgii]
MINFLSFMLFSSLEFFALIFLIFSLFTFKLKFYLKEFIFTSIFMTFVSYGFVITNLNDYIVILQIPILILLFRFIFKEKKWLYASWIVVSGYISYICIQAMVALLFVFFKFQSVESTMDAFDYTSYTGQLISATIAITIAMYINVYGQSFGFTFRITRKNPIYYLLSILSIIVAGISYYIFSIQQNFALIILFASVIIILTSVLLYFSNKQDHEEFS